jgi:hypothetical protein
LLLLTGWVLLRFWILLSLRCLLLHGVILWFLQCILGILLLLSLGLLLLLRLWFLLRRLRFIICRCSFLRNRSGIVWVKAFDDLRILRGNNFSWFLLFYHFLLVIASSCNFMGYNLLLFALTILSFLRGLRFGFSCITLLVRQFPLFLLILNTCVVCTLQSLLWWFSNSVWCLVLDMIRCLLRWYLTIRLACILSLNSMLWSHSLLFNVSILFSQRKRCSWNRLRFLLRLLHSISVNYIVIACMLQPSVVTWAFILMQNILKTSFFTLVILLICPFL